MKLRKAFTNTVRVLVLFVLFIVLFTIATNLTTPSELAQRLSPEQVSRIALMLPLVALLMVGILVYLVRRSRWHGWKLSGAILLIFYGIYTFLAQMESAVFAGVASRLPPGMLGGLFLSGALLAVPFSLLAVWILGKTRKDSMAGQPNDRLIMPAREWAWRLALIAVLYVIIYFTFGYYIAWKTPGLPEFYGGQDLGFLPGFAVTMRDTPWLPFFQLLRALIWTAFGCIIIRMHKGGVLETSLAVGLAFSILMAAPLLLPNPIMGDVVARAHLYEVGSSNLLFGFLVSMILLWRRR